MQALQSSSENLIKWLVLGRSLKYRMVLLVAALVIITTGLLQLYTLHQFEKASELNLRHEGMLLSDTLEAAILPIMHAGDVDAVQRHINRLVHNRQVNDIEVNIMELVPGGSSIVASNVPDNIEATDEEEHQELLKALSLGKPTLFIDVESNDFEEDDIDPEEMLEFEHSDNYIQHNTRFMSITTPLLYEGMVLGGINLKLSLSTLDARLRQLKGILMVVMLGAFLAILGGVTQLLNRKIFQPLKIMQRELNHVANGEFEVEVKAEQRQDEIGDLARTFNSMAVQLRETQQQLHQYLNPMAIKEAYRRVREDISSPSVEEKNVSILFVDIVNFTATSESLGPGASVRYLNQFHDLVAGAILESGGYIDKIVADELICVFDSSQHADQAVNAARRILWLVKEYDAFQVRIGINSGNCIIADVGSHTVGRMDRTVIGDTVNVAQRLMVRAEPDRVVFSLSTYYLLTERQDDIFELRMENLKGKRFPVKSFEIRLGCSKLSVRPNGTPMELALAG